MKKIITIIILSVVLILLIAASVFLYNSLAKEYTAPVDDSEVLEKVLATDFVITDATGNTIKLSDFFGKPIVVNFWATWCSPCKMEMPYFEKAYKELDDVQFLMVNVGDNLDKALTFANENSYTFPVYSDSGYSATMAYGVSSIPMTLFINADGELVHSQIGTLSEEVLKSYIELIR